MPVPETLSFHPLQDRQIRTYQESDSLTVVALLSLGFALSGGLTFTFIRFPPQVHYVEQDLGLNKHSSWWLVSTAQSIKPQAFDEPIKPHIVVLPFLCISYFGFQEFITL
jgi:hypothetical protein